MNEHRRTEQGDEVTDEHAIEPKEGKPEQPYRPPRQPAQEQPDEPVKRGGAPGSEAGGDEPRPAPGD
jgi:hypothetical protein